MRDGIPILLSLRNQHCITYEILAAFCLYDPENADLRVYHLGDRDPYDVAVFIFPPYPGHMFPFLNCALRLYNIMLSFHIAA